MDFKETWRWIWAKDVSVINIEAGARRRPIRKIAALCWRAVKHRRFWDFAAGATVAELIHLLFERL